MTTSTPFIQGLTLFILLSFLPLAYLLPNGTAVIWVMIFPLLPLFIVLIGFNRWRKLCPLAWFALLGQNAHWFSKHKIPAWFETNYYPFLFSMLFLSFNARLLFLNFEGTFLALFFLTIMLIAFLTNLFFSGKSWCNFICPIGLIEKLYCGTNAHLSHLNSSCSSCTACKKNCPDIDMEKSYWKETNKDARRFVFYSFSGLVFGFYFYYYAISGHWEYYFNGEWTDKLLAKSDLFAPGFFFYTAIPKLFAVPLTLIFFSLLSYVFFSQLEKTIPRMKWAKNKDAKSIQHIVNALAAFVAFNIFYVFAGKPAYAHYPLVYAIFHFAVVVVSTVILWKEVFREERFFLQERFAKKILKKWKGPHKAPTNLKEIYYTYSQQQENRNDKLLLYKETILELLQEGTLNTEDFSFLDKIRAQLGLTQSEHNKILQTLKNKNSAFFDIANTPSLEKIHQLAHYKNTLHEMLDKKATARQMKTAQQRSQIEDNEHQKIYEELTKADKNVKRTLKAAYSRLLHTMQLIASLTAVSEKKGVPYLIFVLKDSFNQKFEKFSKALILIFPDQKEKILSLQRNIGTCFKDPERFYEQLQQLSLDEYQQKLEYLFDIQTSSNVHKENEITFYLAKQLTYNEDETIAAVLFYMYSNNLQHTLNYKSYLHYRNPFISEIAKVIDTQSDTMTKIEFVSYLHAVDLFKTFGIEELHQLASVTEQVTFSDGTHLATANKEEDALYIITEGVADIALTTEKPMQYLSTITTGDCIGEMGIVSNTRRSTSVIANSRVQALKVSKEAFENTLAKNPRLSISIMKDMTSRMLAQKQSYDIPPRPLKATVSARSLPTGFIKSISLTSPTYVPVTMTSSIRAKRAIPAQVFKRWKTSKPLG